MTVFPIFQVVYFEEELQAKYTVKYEVKNQVG